MLHEPVPNIVDLLTGWLNLLNKCPQFELLANQVRFLVAGAICSMQVYISGVHMLTFRVSELEPTGM